MSNVITNLKVRFGADNTNFKKGMAENKQAMGTLKSEGTSAIESLASAFGINVSAISKGASVFSSSMKVMGTSMKTAATGSNVLSGALKKLKIALISTGVGALVVALGSLVAYFTKTKDGSDKLSQAADYLGATFSVIVDRLSAIGSAMIKAFSDPKESISDLWEFVKSQFLNRIKAIPALIKSAWKIVQGIFDSDISSKDAAKEFLKTYLQLVTGLDSSQMKTVTDGVIGFGAEIKNEAAAAAALKKKLQELEDQEIALIEVQANRKKEIAANRLLSKDETYSEEERLAAAKKAVALENETLNEQLEIARKRASIIEQQKALGNNLREDDRELAEAKAKVAELEEQSLTRQRRMVTEINTLTNEINSQNEALKKQRVTLEETLNPQGSLAGAKLSTGKASDYDAVAAAQQRVIDNKNYISNMGIDLPDLTSAVSVWDDYSTKVQSVIIDLGEAINSAMESMVVDIAETFGGMLSGTADLSDFSNTMISTLADLAITVGKIAISTGLAVMGIQAALASLNPAVAIAAGVALVALGTAVKSGLASAASSSGSISSASSTSTSTIDARGSLSNNSATESRQATINITGEFTQKGTDLVAVINETNYKKSVRT